MNRTGKAKEFRKLINANLNATRKLIRVDELDAYRNIMMYNGDNWLDESVEKGIITRGGKT